MFFIGCKSLNPKGGVLLVFSSSEGLPGINEAQEGCAVVPDSIPKISKKERYFILEVQIQYFSLYSF